MRCPQANYSSVSHCIPALGQKGQGSPPPMLTERMGEIEGLRHQGRRTCNHPAGLEHRMAPSYFITSPG